MTGDIFSLTGDAFPCHGCGALIPAAARAGDLSEVRRLVQGGDAGLSELVATVTALQAV